MARVELDGVGKRYPNGFEAVQAFSIDIQPGEFIVLVGPSGCGKSTTLRMVAGLESITTGELRIDGRRVNEAAPKARDVAMVFQSYALYPHMTAFENMAFGLKLQKVPKADIEQRVRKVAEQLAISDLLDRKPKAMSGGQRQRIAIGRAIVRAPKVFLFDEPLSNLDAKLRLQMRVELSKLHRSLGATSLYVTHDQVEAMTLADRIVLLKGGVVQQIGAPLELYDRPDNTFVATFIGSPAMNLLTGERTAAGVTGAGFQVAFQGAGQVGQPVVLGVRPEHLRPVEAGAAVFSGTVEVVEPMGSESFVYCRHGEQLLVVRTKDAPPSPGALMHLAPEPGRLHLFDGATQGRLG
ncbi:MAG: sn-glycerol-3-phosphate ABC transporter ATP-binding protein UgpC [Myxococcales bacterium]|nr:sn-glycerol-3-phosphate ABC transporter ATP-binding protein UgpC [Myxococcales bacterium]